MPTVRLRLLVSYHGGPFRGWQSQAGGGAVQDFLEAAFVKLVGGDHDDTPRVPVHGAGRTDAGVHALGQVAMADVPAGRGPAVFGRWPAALNAHLPPEIRVERVARVRAADWHARFSARGKIYRYRIWNTDVLNPFERGRAWHLPGALDVALLRETARVFLGRHDFAGFAANRGRPETDTTRTVHRAAVHRRGGPAAGAGLVTVEFGGDGFLYHQVRLMVGTLVRVAQGRMAAGALTDLLRAPAGRKTSFAAPAEGLYLVRVLYGRGASRQGREGRKGS